MKAFIYDAIRSPRTKAKETGALHGTKPVALVAEMLGAVATRNDLDPEDVEDVVLGCVTAVGDQGSNLAKIAALYAGWPSRVSGATTNRFCASGLDAIIRAGEDIHCGHGDLVCAGGIEMMSRVPMFADQGAWFADPDVAAKTGFVHMGVAADFVATRQNISRDELDQYAANSHQRAARARDAGHFRSLHPAGGANVDELIRPQATAEANRSLDPLFTGEAFEPFRRMFADRYSGTAVDARHTIATSPATADGAAIALIGSEQAGKKLNAVPRARIAGAAVVGTDPVEMLRGNIPAARRALERAGLTSASVDVCEVNESFAVVPIDFQRALSLDPERVNANGGAISLGHPLGATGGCLVSMCIDELERVSGRYGLVTICGGAGVAAAVVLERLN